MLENVLKISHSAHFRYYINGEMTQNFKTSSRLVKADFTEKEQVCQATSDLFNKYFIRQTNCR